VEDVAEKLRFAINLGGRTEGRRRIIELGLDNETVIKNIVNIYQLYNDKSC